MIEMQFPVYTMYKITTGPLQIQGSIKMLLTCMHCTVTLRSIFFIIFDS